MDAALLALCSPMMLWQAGQFALTPAQKQYSAGRAAYDVRNWAEVIRLLTPIESQFKTDAEFFNTLGNAYFFQGATMYDRALQNYEAAAKINPKNTAYYFNIGSLWRDRAVHEQSPATRQEMWSRAASAYAKSLEIERRNSVDLNFLGGCYYALGRFAEAEKVQREAVSLRPDAGLWFNVGEDCAAQKKLPDAEVAYREAVRLAPSAAKFAPTLARFQNGLGLALFRQEKFADALISFREALKLNPEPVEYSVNVGTALLKLGKPDEARPFVQAARKRGILDTHWAVIQLGLVGAPR